MLRQFPTIRCLLPESHIEFNALYKHQSLIWLDSNRIGDTKTIVGDGDSGRQTFVIT